MDAGSLISYTILLLFEFAGVQFSGAFYFNVLDGVFCSSTARLWILLYGL